MVLRHQATRKTRCSRFSHAKEYHSPHRDRDRCQVKEVAPIGYPSPLLLPITRDAVELPPVEHPARHYKQGYVQSFLSRVDATPARPAFKVYARHDPLSIHILGCSECATFRYITQVWIALQHCVACSTWTAMSCMPAVRESS